MLKNKRRINQNNKEYVESLRPTIGNIKKLYSIENNGRELSRNIDFHEAQLAIGIKTPILNNLEKDIIIADRMINRDKKPYVEDFHPSRFACKKLNMPKFPNDIRELRRMDNEGKTIEYNCKAQYYKNYISEKAHMIEIKHPRGKYSKLGLCKKLKYLSKNLNKELPSDTTWNMNLESLLAYLRILENS